MTDTAQSVKHGTLLAGDPHVAVWSLCTLRTSGSGINKPSFYLVQDPDPNA